jgi:TatD DNase family protein
MEPMTRHWIDAHAHITSDDMPLQAVDLMREAAAAGCVGLVEVATDAASLQRAWALQRACPVVAVAAAVTPHEAASFDPAFVELIDHAVREGKIQAVGETGLDYFHWKETERVQKIECARQLELAAISGLPVIIHCRDAFEDFFALLDHHYSQSGRWLPGMLHCFTGNRQEALVLIEKGWMVSISGVVTYKKSEELRQIVPLIPDQQLLIETDAPWLAPQSQRGKTNRPVGLLETAEMIARLRQQPVEQVLRLAADNARRLIPFKGWASAQTHETR